MSDNAPPDLPSIRELEALVRHLADELANFRRRALVAEARLKEVESQEGGAVSLDLAARVGQLERENEKLQRKLETAGDRARQMLDRVRFLRQQAQGGER
jgi:predicted RNase H-like nuclease (RuvC/YqgF family)